MTFVEDELGLRERKRLATRRAIERAVLTLSLERGYEKVTVDDISHAADISPRTFFNYFPSKEAAVIGELPALPGAGELEEFLGAGSRGEPLMDGLRDLLIAAADNDHSAQERDLHEMRRELLKTDPQLFALRMATMKHFEEEFNSIIERRVALDHPELAASPDRLRSRARLYGGVAIAAMRHAWTCWADAGGVGTLSERLRESFAQLWEIAVWR
jgi:AcrR family transcriptional regulator